MSKFQLFIVCIGVFLTSCLASEDSCSKLDLMEKMLEKMVRTELNFEQLEANVNIVHSKVEGALKSAGSQIEILESKMHAFEEDVAKRLNTLDEQFNYTNVVTKKLAELGISLESPTTTCPDGWTSFQGSCYYFGETDLSFAMAERFCEDVQAHLANIETEVENNFIRGHLRLMKALKHWIGATDEAVEGTWRFHPSDKLITFFDWGARQPNNGRVSNCMAIWESFGYLWVDEPCRNRFRPICEKKVNSCG